MNFFQVKFAHTTNDVIIQCDEWRCDPIDFIEFYDYDAENDKLTTIAWYAKSIVFAIIPQPNKIKSAFE